MASGTADLSSAIMGTPGHQTQSQATVSDNSGRGESLAALPLFASGLLPSAAATGRLSPTPSAVSFTEPGPLDLEMEFNPGSSALGRRGANFGNAMSFTCRV